MPFVFDRSSQPWPEDLDDEAWDDYEPPPPTAADFEYLAPPQFGGGREPVRFADPTAGESAEAVRPERPFGLVDRLLRPAIRWAARRRAEGLRSEDPDLPGPGRMTTDVEEQRRQATERRATLLGVMLPALRDLGGTHVRAVYDGGDDEGFVWFRELRTTNGTLSLDQTLEALAAAGIAETLRRAGLFGDGGRITRLGGYRSDHDRLHDTLKYELVDGWAVALLGRGFGTGDFEMYGAFTVDLHTRTITDDPQATVPQDGNTAIARDG